MTARDVGGTTDRNSLSARQADGAAMLMEVDAAAVAKLLLVMFIAEGREVIRRLPVRKEEEQPQKLAVNAPRDRHAEASELGPVRVVCVCVCVRVRAYSVRARDVFAHLLAFRGDISRRLGPFPQPDATERQQRVTIRRKRRWRRS